MHMAKNSAKKLADTGKIEKHRRETCADTCQRDHTDD